MTPQVRGVFPLAEALQLAVALGYCQQAMAELLPLAAGAVTETLLAQKLRE